MDKHTRQEASSPLWTLAPVWSFNEAATLGEAAASYARVGAPVFPLERGGKSPLVPRGVYAATCDPDVIQRWWRRWPDANIGVPMGKPSGCWALDVDPRHGGLESLKHHGRDPLLSWEHIPEAELHATRVQLTGGGGVHLCYQMRPLDGVQLSNATGFAGYPGLDLRVSGGYIVVAPSRHKSGSIYRWGNDLPLLPFPELLVERWRAHRQRAFARPSLSSSGAFSTRSRPRVYPRPDVPDVSCDHRECDPEYWLRCALRYGRAGCRHNYALFLAFHLIDDVGMVPEEAEAYLVRYAHQVPQDDHPFPVAEALACLYDAAKRRGLLVG